MNKVAGLLVVVLSCVAYVGSAAAQLQETNIKTTCAYLYPKIVTEGWVHYYDLNYGCSSSYKQFGAGYPLRNNIAYYVEGDDKSANKLKIILNVNYKEEAKLAHQEMLKTSTLLIHEALSTSIPKDISDSIIKGRNAKAKVAGASIKLTRFNWPTGKGYELQLEVQ